MDGPLLAIDSKVAHAKSHALVLCGLFLLLTVLHTLARAYPGGVEEKGTGKASKSDDPVQIRKNPAAGRQPVAEGVT